MKGDVNVLHNLQEKTVRTLINDIVTLDVPNAMVQVSNNALSELTILI